MSASPTRSSRDIPSNEEEQLPLYEQYEQPQEDKHHQIALPENEAMPDQVREFLEQLLVKERCLAIDHSQRIAARWTIGKGNELRSYPPAMYLETFGREDGWIVYREVKLCIYREEHQKKKELAKKAGWPAMVIFIVLLFALTAALGYGFYCSLSGPDDHFLLALCIGFLFLPTLFLSIGAVVSFFEQFSTPNHEKKVEDELRKCVDKPSAPT